MKLTIKNFTKLQGTEYTFQGNTWTCYRILEEDEFYSFHFMSDQTSKQALALFIRIERKACGKNFENKMVYKFSETNKIFFTAHEIETNPIGLIKELFKIK